MKTPYYSSGVFIETSEIYTKIYAKLGMVLMWNQQDALMVCTIKVFLIGISYVSWDISVGKKNKEEKKEKKKIIILCFSFFFSLFRWSWTTNIITIPVVSVGITMEFKSTMSSSKEVRHATILTVVTKDRLTSLVHRNITGEQISLERFL